jgi:hypothetical protein
MDQVISAITWQPGSLQVCNEHAGFYWDRDAPTPISNNFLVRASQHPGSGPRAFEDNSAGKGPA